MTPIDLAPMSDTARSILRLVVGSGELRESSERIGERLYVDIRTVKRAVAELVWLGLVSVERDRGGRGHVRTIRTNSDTDAKLRALCHRLGREGDGQPGAEYTRPLDEAEARRDRAERYRARFGKLPSWAEGGAR